MSHANGTVYDRLRRKIVDDRWDHDRVLIPAALAEEFGTSRAPVREALQLLSQEGLVVPGRRGYSLRRRSNEEMLELFEARAELDGILAFHAAGRATTVDMVMIEEAQRESESADDEADVRAALRMWHAAVRKAGRNEALLRTLLSYDEQIQLGAPWAVGQGARTFEDSIGEHGLVLQHLRAGDAAAAREAIIEHHRRDRDERIAQLVRQQLRERTGPGDRAPIAGGLPPGERGH